MHSLIARRSCLFGLGGSALLIGTGVRALPLEGPRAVLQKYFRLINQRRFYAAFHVWELREDGRNDFGQTLKQFTAGFARTKAVSADIGPEGERDGAAGSQFLELSVTLTSILKSGKKQLFEGSFMMRRSTVPGGHRDWLIYTAKLTPADRD